MHKTVYHASRMLVLVGVLVLAGCASHPALIQATEDNDPQRVARLLQNGADPDVRDDMNTIFGEQTALYVAAKNGNNEIVKRLLAAGADVNKGTNNEFGFGSPLLAASLPAFEGNAETVRLLVQAGADVNAQNKYGSTALIYLARGFDSPETIQLLIDAGADVNHVSKQGWAPLMVAVWHNRLKVAQILLENGADPEKENAEHKNAYALAREKKGDVTPEKIQQYRDVYLVKTILEDVVRVEQRDVGLSEQLKHDKYLIAYTDALKQERYKDAILYANLLDRLGTPMENSFYYFWGEALLKMNDAKEARTKLNYYIKEAGAGGKYYTQALRLILQTEH